MTLKEFLSFLKDKKFLVEDVDIFWPEEQTAYQKALEEKERKETLILDMEKINSPEEFLQKI
jgi:hypothetical protein